MAEAAFAGAPAGRLRGVDVSVYQGDVHWGDAKQALGLSFAFVKIAEGMNQKPDPKATSNVTGIRDAGLALGGYFFLRPATSVDPIVQARLHRELAQDVGYGRFGDMIPAIDVEEPLPTAWSSAGFTPVSFRSWVLAYAVEMKKLWGLSSPPLLYSYLSFLQSMGAASDPASFLPFPLWVAWYESAWPGQTARPLLPRPWTDWAFWQWSGGRAVVLPNGATTDADLFNGGEAELQRYLLRPGLGATLTTA